MTKKTWEKQFNEKYCTTGCGKALVIIEDDEYGGTSQRPFHKEIKELIQSLLDKKEQELRSPMGCTQWKTTGIKYSYWKYFMDEVLKEKDKEIMEIEKIHQKEINKLLDKLK